MNYKKTLVKSEYSKQLILEFLALNGATQLGKIMRYLESKNQIYSKKGLILKLEKMQKEKRIQKYHTSGKRHPEYSLVDKNLIELYKMGAEVLDISTNFKISFLSFLNEQKNSNDDVEGMIKKTIQKIGTHVILSHLNSWKLTSKKQSVTQNRNLREMWNELIIRDITEYHFHLIRYFLDTMKPKIKNRPGLIYEDKERIKRLFKLEKILNNLYPEECKNFKDIMDSSQNIRNKEFWKLEQ